MKKNSDGWVNINNKDVKSISTNSSINPLQAETIYLVDSTTSSVTLRIASSSVEYGKSITIKDSQGNSETNNIIVDTEGTETIDGSASLTIQILIHRLL